MLIVICMGTEYFESNPHFSIRQHYYLVSNTWFIDIMYDMLIWILNLIFFFIIYLVGFVHIRICCFILFLYHSQIWFMIYLFVQVILWKQIWAIYICNLILIYTWYNTLIYMFIYLFVSLLFIYLVIYLFVYLLVFSVWVWCYAYPTDTLDNVFQIISFLNGCESDSDSDSDIQL